MAYPVIFYRSFFQFTFINNTFKIGFLIVEYKIDKNDRWIEHIITTLRDLFMFKIIFWSDYFERTLV